MIEYVVENLRPESPHRFIFVHLKEHLSPYSKVFESIKHKAPNSEFIALDDITEGAACTVLKAQEFIDNEDPLMIANSDQYVDCEIDKFLGALSENPHLHGLVMTFHSEDPKWSYCEIDKFNSIRRIAEKEVISKEATVGIYAFKRGADFVRSAEKMIHQNEQVKGEYYVAPAYNRMIEAGKKISPYPIGEENEKMFGLGTPEDFKAFTAHNILKTQIA